ncbi:MAG: hypothetical protein KTR31_17250 [Myxococcales bacterium]|nr:hypothetical protein [Myxococcales bacterium]
MSSALERIRHQVPAEALPVLQRLLEEPLKTPEELLLEVDAYAGFVDTYARDHPEVDAAAARTLAQRCRAVIDRARGRSEELRRLVQIACLYLVVIEDDLDTRTGFDDDSAVLDAVDALLAD